MVDKKPETDKEQLIGASKTERTVRLYNEYKSDPISFVDKYGKGAVENLMSQLNRPMVDAMTGKSESLKQKLRMQMGGMADMSAAPMMQPRKKKKPQSGFRSKYSKGGGVRTTKYKI